MKSNSSIRAFVLTLSLLSACKAPKVGEPNLEPPDRRPVYHTQVGDATEAELLHQQLGIEVKNLMMNDLLFYARDDSTLQKLRALGYRVDTADLRQAYSQIVRVEGGDEKALSRYGVNLINREGGYAVVRGSLEALTRLREGGFKLVALEEEVRPREILITGKGQADVQRIYELGVDIFTAVKDSTGNFTVHGSAFDFQIDSLRSLGYTVNVTKDRI